MLRPRNTCSDPETHARDTCSGRKAHARGERHMLGAKDTCSGRKTHAPAKDTCSRLKTHARDTCFDLKTQGPAGHTGLETHGYRHRVRAEKHRVGRRRAARTGHHRFRRRAAPTPGTPGDANFYAPDRSATPLRTEQEDRRADRAEREAPVVSTAPRCDHEPDDTCSDLETPAEDAGFGPETQAPAPNTRPETPGEKHRGRPEDTGWGAGPDTRTARPGFRRRATPTPRIGGHELLRIRPFCRSTDPVSA